MKGKFNSFVYFFFITCFILSLALCVSAQDNDGNTSSGNTISADDINHSSESEVEIKSTSIEVDSTVEVDQEKYKKRVKYEVITSAVILLTFFFFVALISMIRFKRGIKHLAKIEKDKKLKYKDIWGNPRVQLDDMPTDDEMQGIDKLDDE